MDWSLALTHTHTPTLSLSLSRYFVLSSFLPLFLSFPSLLSVLLSLSVSLSLAVPVCLSRSTSQIGHTQAHDTLTHSSTHDAWLCTYLGVVTGEDLCIMSVHMCTVTLTNVNTHMYLDLDTLHMPIYTCIYIYIYTYIHAHTYAGTLCGYFSLHLCVIASEDHGVCLSRPTHTHTHTRAYPLYV